MGPSEMLPVGLYEDLVTLRIRERVVEFIADRRVAVAAVDDAEQPHLLGRHVAAVVERVLAEVKPSDRVRVANDVLMALAEAGKVNDVVESHLAVLESGRSELLMEVLGGDLGAVARRRPQLPLRRTDLLVNDRGEPRLAHEVAAEIASADRVDPAVRLPQVERSPAGGGRPHRGHRPGCAGAGPHDHLRWRHRRASR